MMSFIAELWEGRVPLGRAFWSYAVVVGLIVSALSTLVALILMAIDAPNALVLAAFLAHLPWNLFMLVAVWRSADNYQGPAKHAQAARLVVVLWTIALVVV